MIVDIKSTLWAHVPPVVGQVWGNADSWATLEWVTGLTIVFQLFFYGIQYSKEWDGCLLWPAEVIASGIEGSKEYFSGAVALMLALTFSDTMKNLQIAQYLVSSLGRSHDRAVSRSKVISEAQWTTWVQCACFALSGLAQSTVTPHSPHDNDCFSATETSSLHLYLSLLIPHWVGWAICKHWGSNDEIWLNLCHMA